MKILFPELKMPQYNLFTDWSCYILSRCIILVTFEVLICDNLCKELRYFTLTAYNYKKCASYHYI